MSDDTQPRPDKGFPKMPHPNDMLPMFTDPPPADKRQPRNGSPIREWEAVLVGKRLVEEDAEDDEITFKKSDLPANTRYLPGAINTRVIIGRLNVWIVNHVVTRVYYG